MKNQRSSLRKLLLGFLIACALIQGAAAAAPSTAPASKPLGKAGAELNLALVGYNYTSRYIDTFSVNGQGGGNVYVSSPTSGGGGTVCCVSYRKGATAYEVTVRWHAGGCMYRAPARMADGRTHLGHSFFRELRVKVDPHIPDGATNFEVHFYPDGHVEAAITARASAPRVVSSEDRADRSEYQRCPGDKEPKQ
ncbi:MAG: hypothetical protein JWQ01_2571 [Massilia sp.]|nr:hypothetical protein [Massilia sp.]